VMNQLTIHKSHRSTEDKAMQLGSLRFRSATQSMEQVLLFFGTKVPTDRNDVTKQPITHLYATQELPQL